MTKLSTETCLRRPQSAVLVMKLYEPKYHTVSQPKRLDACRAWTAGLMEGAEGRLGGGGVLEGGLGGKATGRGWVGVWPEGVSNGVGVGLGGRGYGVPVCAWLAVPSSGCTISPQSEAGISRWWPSSSDERSSE